MPGVALSAPEIAPSQASGGTGFYGKVPTHGDFVGQRLPRIFRDHWDAWLAEAVQTSRTLMGGDWLPAYLSAPLWRFVVGHKVCGPKPMMGVVMASVDRVGRYYPLTIAAELPAGTIPASAFSAFHAWFNAVETLALSALGDEFELDAFDIQLAALQVEAMPQPATDTFISSTGVRVGGSGAQSVEELYPALIHGAMGRFLSPYSLWSTSESDPPSTAVILCSGLPDPATFPAFFDGQWQRWGWATE